MKKQEIVSVLYELYKITGFRMSLHDTNFVEIAAYPENTMPICARIHSSAEEYEKCKNCDTIAFKTVLKTKEPLIYKCRFGLTEAVSPLYNFGILTGFLMMGQIADTETDIEETLSGLMRIGIGENEAEKLVSSMHTASANMIRSYVKIMTICAQYLTLSNALPGAKPSVAESAKRFIHENLEKRLTIKDICESVRCSKTTLISAFKREFKTTVNQAIIDAKLTEAKRLLTSSDLSISAISALTGFYDQSYFSKVFSAEMGITPSEYRRKNNTNHA